MAEYQIFPMHLAAAAGDTERVESLIELGMSMDTQDKKGETIRQLAIIHGGRSRFAAVDCRKCDGCNQCAKAAYTPLLISAMYAHKDIVDLLLRRGASISGTDGSYFASFLHWAASKGWTDVVQLVIEREKDVGRFHAWNVPVIEVTDKYERTPLMWAASWSRKDVVAILIQAGADVNRADETKKTALHLSCIDNYLEVVQILLETEGLFLDPQDILGETPLHKECRHGHVEVMEKLLAAGADPSIRNTMFETAFRMGLRWKRFSPKEIGLFVQKGVFFEDWDYARILENSDLKDRVLTDVDICTQSIINKFHYKELPAIYCNCGFAAKNLPRISKLRLNTQEIQDIKNFVELDIGTNTFCDVLKARPIVLKVMTVKSLKAMTAKSLITTPAPLFKKSDNTTIVMALNLLLCFLSFLMYVFVW